MIDELPQSRWKAAARALCGLLGGAAANRAGPPIEMYSFAARRPAGPKVPTSVDMPLSDELKRALVFAAEEADRLDPAEIGNSAAGAGR